MDLFLTIAGFIIGLGAVTVIDIHGALARRSSYWTLATIRTHKVTKPLIWIGMVLVAFGMLWSFSLGYLDEGQFLIRGLIMILLMMNGAFLSFVVSPELEKRESLGMEDVILPDSLQRKIMMSFILSFAGWWVLVGLFVCSLIH